jgi:hypothetical protein
MDSFWRWFSCTYVEELFTLIDLDDDDHGHQTEWEDVLNSYINNNLIGNQYGKILLKISERYYSYFNANNISQNPAYHKYKMKQMNKMIIKLLMTYYSSKNIAVNDLIMLKHNILPFHQKSYNMHVVHLIKKISA